MSIGQKKIINNDYEAFSEFVEYINKIYSERFVLLPKEKKIFHIRNSVNIIQLIAQAIEHDLFNMLEIENKARNIKDACLKITESLKIIIVPLS
ncbi:MAG: hypothetical protein ACTSRI_08785 [Promethearchaeota archaeon]